MAVISTFKGKPGSGKFITIEHEVRLECYAGVIEDWNYYYIVFDGERLATELGRVSAERLAEKISKSWNKAA